MAKNAMQSAWENKRKEEERLQKVKMKKKQEATVQAVKAEEQTTEGTAAKAKKK